MAFLKVNFLAGILCLFTIAVYEKEFSIRGFHIYKEVWLPVEEEILDTVRERTIHTTNILWWFLRKSVQFDIFRE